MSRIRVLMFTLAAFVGLIHSGNLHAGLVTGWQDLDVGVETNGTRWKLSTRMTVFKFDDVVASSPNEGDFATFIPDGTPLGRFWFKTEEGIRAGWRVFGSTKFGTFTGSEVTLLKNEPGELDYRIDGVFEPGTLFPTEKRDATPSWLKISLSQPSIGQPITASVRLTAVDPVISIGSTPEPSTIVLASLAALGLVVTANRRRAVG